MASSDGERPNYGKRIFWLAMGILIVIALYTAGWFYAASLLAQEVQAGVASMNGGGRRANCESVEVRGYPFRIGVFCRSVMFEDAHGGVGLRAGQFRSAAQIYAPRRVIAELDGPASLEAPGLSALDLNWSSLRSSVRLSMPLPELVSVEARDLVVTLDRTGGDQPVLAQTGVAELHLRPAGNDLDLAVRFSRLAITEALTGSDALPPLDGLVDISVADGALQSGLGEDWVRGKSGTIRTITLSAAGKTVATVSGPVSVDPFGLVNAELQVTLHDAPAMAQILGALLPDVRHEIELSLTSLAATAETPTLPLRIAGGDMRLGFLSLGSIPPL